MLDKQASGGGYPAHPARVWGAVPPRARQQDRPGVGLSVQVPAARATQRDEVASEHWKTERWPELKKAQAEGRTIVWLNEFSGFAISGQGSTT